MREGLREVSKRMVERIAEGEMGEIGREVANGVLEESTEVEVGDAGREVGDVLVELVAEHNLGGGDGEGLLGVDQDEARRVHFYLGLLRNSNIKI